MDPLFLAKRDFISANAVLRLSKKYADLCQHSLTVSEEMLLQFIYYPHDCDHVSSIPNSFSQASTFDVY